MQDVLNGQVHVTTDSERIEAMRITLPTRAGMIAGFAGALAVIAVVTAVVVAVGEGLFTAPRVIASAIYGNMVTGFLPVVVGTLIHLVTGTLLGAGFAQVMPRVYRTLWMVAGIFYGIAAWIVSSVVVLPIIAPAVLSEANYAVLLMAHIAYGAILGALAATYGLWWGRRNDPERITY